MDALEAQFHKACSQIDAKFRKKHPRSGAFEQMLNDKTAVDAVKSLLQGPLQFGFMTALEDRTPELTVEHLVVQSQYQSLFMPEEIAIAKARLQLFERQK